MLRLPVGSKLGTYRTTVEVQVEGQIEMYNPMMEIVAKEWLREQLREAEDNRLIREARLAAAAQARDARPRPARLALLTRRLTLAVRRLARVAAAS